MTRRRLLVGLALAVAALAAFIIEAVFGGLWWVPALALCVLLGAWILYGERRVRWVPYRSSS